MAGYFTRLNGHVYEGRYKAQVALSNGQFAIIANELVEETRAKKNNVLRVTEKTELFGMPALRLEIVGGTDEVYMVENEWDYNDSQEFDESKYTCKVGEFVRMRRLLVGDQVLVSVGADLHLAAAIGTEVQPVEGGLLNFFTP